MVQEAETHAEDDKIRRESIEAKNNASALIHSTEKNLEEHGDKIPETDRTEIEGAVQALKDVLESEDTDEIKSKSEALMQVAMKLGEAMYKDSQGDPVPGWMMCRMIVTRRNRVKMAPKMKLWSTLILKKWSLKKKTNKIRLLLVIPLNHYRVRTPHILGVQPAR